MDSLGSCRRYLLRRCVTIYKRLTTGPSDLRVGATLPEQPQAFALPPGQQEGHARDPTEMEQNHPQPPDLSSEFPGE